MSDLFCPSCDTKITGAAGLNAAVMMPGAVVVCLHCRALAIFTIIGSLRQPKDAELDHLLTKPEIIHAIQVVADFHRQHGAPKAG